MQRKVNVQTNQQLSQADLDNFGNFPRESFDHIVRDLGGHPAPRYTGFLTEQTGPSEIRVGAGRFYRPDGAVFGYDSEQGAAIDLLDHLPAVAKRVATIVVYANTIDTDLEPRTFLVDAATGETEGREVAVESRRQAFVEQVLGQESATPQPPAINADYVAIAEVLLTPAGIEAVTQITANRLHSVRSNAERIAEHDARFAAVGPQIDTLKTDISGLGISLRGKAETTFVRQIAYDVARVKEEVGLPDDYTAWGADRYLNDSESDPAFAGYSAAIAEGVRFPAAASATLPLALQNPLEDRVMVNDAMALPSFRKALRLSVVGRDGEYALTSTTVENVQLQARTEARTRTVYYGTERHCTNSAWWHSGEYDPVSGILTRNGEIFRISDDYGQRDGPNGLTHWIRADRYVQETFYETYWDRIVTTENVAGSIVGQTFLNSQDGWITGLNLFFTRKAQAGDVRVLVCETVNGEPALDRVIAKKTLTPADLALWPAKTPVALKPTFLVKGRRYALVLISAGAHFVATVADNKFAQGTIFYSTDGAFVQAGLFTDLAFEAEFAVFDAPIVTVDLAPIELAGGIGRIDINADASLPEGTSIDYQVRIGTEWRTLGPNDETILAGQPSLAQFRVRMIGTTDVMPALGLGAQRSAVRVSRGGGAFDHVSEIRTMPAAVDTVELQLRLENWDAALHTATPTILTGAAFGTIETPDAVVDTPDPRDPDAIIRTATFNLAGPVPAYRIRIAGATTDTAKHFHVAERVDVAFTS